MTKQEKQILPPSTEVVAKGVFAGMLATLLVHPLDVVKVRQQIFPGNCGAFRLARHILKCEGLRPFYCGLTAGLLRQLTNTGTRLAVYDMLYNSYAVKYDKSPVSYDKLMIGLMAGLAGALAGNPSEVVLIRRMCSGCHRCPPRCHSSYYLPGYKGTINALATIMRQEGVLGLWRGVTLTLIRSSIVGASQMGIYINVRQYLNEKEVAPDSFYLSLYSSVITTFIGALVSHPIDLMKSIYQLSNNSASPSKIFSRIIRYRGVLGLWRGFNPYFVRMAVHTIIIFMVLEEIEKNNIKL